MECLDFGSSSVCAEDAFFTEPMTTSSFSGAKVWRLTYEAVSMCHVVFCITLLDFHTATMVIPILQMERWSLNYTFEN